MVVDLQIAQRLSVEFWHNRLRVYFLYRWAVLHVGRRTRKQFIFIKKMSWVDVNVLLNLLRKKKFMRIQICNPYTISWLSLTNLLRRIPWLLSFLNFFTCCGLAVRTWKLKQLQICGCGVEELRGCGFNNLETSLRTCGSGLKFWTSNCGLAVADLKKWNAFAELRT